MLDMRTARGLGKDLILGIAQHPSSPIVGVSLTLQQR